MSFLGGMLESLLRVVADGVGAQAVILSRESLTYTAGGAAVHSTWQGLAGVYVAPEAETLFAATLPIQDTAAALGDDVLTVSTALAVFTAVVRRLQDEARALIVEADAAEKRAAETSATIAMAGSDLSYGFDPMSADRDRLMEAAAALMAEFNQAEITCANQISSVTGGVQLVANNGDDIVADNEYGLTAGQWIDTWGGLSLNRTVPAGIATAFTNTFEDFKALIAGDSDAWLGLWRTGATLNMALTGTTVINDFVDLPGLPAGGARQTQIDMAKGMLAWDEWPRNPANAFGQVLFNFGTLALGGGAIGVGGRLARSARVGLTAVSGVAKTRIGALARSAGVTLADLRIPTLHLNPRLAQAGGGRIGLPDVTVGSRRLGGTSAGQALANVNDARSLRGGDGRSSTSRADRGIDDSSKTGKHDTDRTDPAGQDTKTPGAGRGSPDRTSSSLDVRANHKGGNEFDRRRRPVYTARGGANEVHVGVLNPKTKQYTRLDSWIPDEAIVSRKSTQLDRIRKSTAFKYLREIIRKYNVGTPVAKTATNKRDLGEDHPEVLTGDLILEVPVQLGKPPVPTAVLDKAKSLGIRIISSNDHEFGPDWTPKKDW